MQSTRKGTYKTLVVDLGRCNQDNFPSISLKNIFYRCSLFFKGKNYLLKNHSNITQKTIQEEEGLLCMNMSFGLGAGDKWQSSDPTKG